MRKPTLKRPPRAPSFKQWIKSTYRGPGALEEVAEWTHVYRPDEMRNPLSNTADLVALYNTYTNELWDTVSLMAQGTSMDTLGFIADAANKVESGWAITTPEQFAMIVVWLAAGEAAEELRG